MTKEEILSKLIPIISTSLSRPETEIIPEASFTHDLGADSMDVVQLMTDIEKEFDLSFSDKEIEAISTVQNAVDMLYSRLQ